MGNVVHLIKNEYDTNIVLLCGHETAGTTTTCSKTLVTCPGCLEKLGVKPEVDEEKVAFAMAIYMDDILDDCRYCMKDSIFDHDNDCIVPKAEAYLKSVKGE